jgi:hypothetical protein
MRNALEFAVLALVCCRPGAEAAPPPDAPSVAQRTSPPPSKRELSFHFQVDVGVEPSTHTEYDDDLDRPVEVSLPQSLRKWSCMRTKVTADEKKGALEAGFNCRTSDNVGASVLASCKVTESSTGDSRMLIYAENGANNAVAALTVSCSTP